MAILEIELAPNEQVQVEQAARQQGVPVGEWARQRLLDSLSWTAAALRALPRERREKALRGLAAQAMSDPGFVRDSLGIHEAFRHADAEHWPRDGYED